MEMAANSRGQVKDPIRSLTIKEILVAMKGKVTLTREQRFRKDMLIDRIYEATPAEDLEKLIEARAQKQMEKAKSATHRGQKCKRAPSVPAALLVESMAEADEVDSNSSNIFLELPTDAERKQCYAHFYDATSNTAVEHCICRVCAQECVFGRAEETKSQTTKDVTGKWTLDRMHSMATASADVPQTVIDRTLVSSHLCVQTISKTLAGRTQHGIIATSHVQECNSINGGRQSNAPPPAILASLISVTFIAFGEVPKKWLHSTFQVRRQVVLEALHWMKDHNPKYYRNIEIRPTRINTLPEDDMPEEITAIIQQSEDVGVLEEENDGYVPPDYNEVMDHGDKETEVSEGTTINSEEPDVVPLQVSGTVDMDMTSMTANELTLWGLANLWKDGKEGGYAVRHGQ
ncbi:hypothetical protein SCLCIDRAFT_10447 [Scleroderma citrinum Foug A]|uniref:DUF6570 domain-containing protein n=1 Tax=Scleroderma citrinum Foug A TaxID=1036808 RepID=A0A0C3DN92_9AGAM|nr:hypothetical protein SCLCIDRAFT_10447 [Scleroderma citrinum Foug A]